ncbi:lysosomal alpha-mannosidase-like [Tubulanus polymorphus]|uniref:lysosomal alpha-mannosidase-like n=1 Tax=Tubulanus polymorphus TaxID=672921 RepID=UPI003DA42FD2
MVNMYWFIFYGVLTFYLNCFVFVRTEVKENVENISNYMPNNYRPETEDKARDEPKCGYEACDAGKSGMLNIHLIPHSHDDVGYTKTVDQYFYGAHNEIRTAGVQYILDSVVAQLMKDSRKRFIYVEMAFFYRWWRQQDDTIRHDITNLVNSGRLEFILGGWSMNDEASTHYSGIIDQHTLGLKFIKDNFGECGRPRVAWQIDPFGQSKEQSSLFAMMGYDGLYFARIDYQDKAKRKKDKQMEMVWKTSNSIPGEKSTLFSGVLYEHYGAPSTFCFDLLCIDPPVMDDPRLHDYNVNERVEDFIAHAQTMAKSYRTNHIMQTMGGDFAYQDANMWFTNTDKLIRYINNRQANGSKVNIFYSTPSCYLYATNKAGLTWPTKSDDFFPYASDAHQMWSGYFTSRPALKYYERQANRFLQVCKQLDTFAQLQRQFGSDLKIRVLKEAMGVVQHHDGVSGTERQHVAYDYAMRLAKGILECEDVVNESMRKLLSVNKSKPLPRLTFCHQTNISLCSVSSVAKQFTMVVYNPLSRPVTAWLQIPVNGNAYNISDTDGHPLAATIIPVSQRTQAIPERKSSNYTSRNDIVMKVELPAMGLNTYLFQLSKNVALKMMQSYGMYDVSGPYTFENQHLRLYFDGQTGMISRIDNLDEQLHLPLHQSLRYYTGFPGNNSQPKFQASGAYVFRPTENESNLITNRVRNTLIKGKMVLEMHQEFSPWATQVVRLRDNEKYVEIEWTVGPIPISDGKGREVVNYFQSGLKTHSMFYTDANGRETQTRRRNYRPTWTLQQTEPVAGNYYPINAYAYLKDEQANVQLTVLTDRSQGGGSITDGSLEIMVHRRLLHDDRFGVGEALNETGSDKNGLIVRGRHYICLDRPNRAVGQMRELAKNIFNSPVAAFTETKLTFNNWKTMYNVSWSGLKKQLPPNIHLLTLEQWDGGDILIRLEHFYEVGDPSLSAPASVDLRGLFQPFEVKAVDELMLAANQRKADSKRLKWNYTDEEQTERLTQIPEHTEKDPLVIIMSAMEIRTFQVTLA